MLIDFSSCSHFIDLLSEKIPTGLFSQRQSFVLDELLWVECKRWKDDRKRRLFWGEVMPVVVVWKILGSDGLRALLEWEWSAVCLLSCPQLANIWWGRGGPLPYGSQEFIKLDVNCKLAFLESLYWCKLRPQRLHFENVVTGVKAVNPSAQGMNKTHIRPVLLWNTYLQCNTGFRRGVMQLLIWLLHKPRSWVTAVFHFCTYIPVSLFLIQNSSLWGTRREYNVI